MSYLHSNDLIYCDLKTDNALVFSLDPQDPVNIKLTDYGISRQMIGPGGHGDAGPPGFCAPEILQHDIFGQKVMCCGVGSGGQGRVGVFGESF